MYNKKWTATKKNMKPKIKLYDRIFAHAHTMSNGTMDIEPEYFTWYRGDDPCDVAIYSDFSLSNVDDFVDNHKYNIALLMESPGVFPAPYEQIKDIEDKFDYIFTFCDELLSRSDKYIRYYLGGTWIPESDWAIYNKTKMVSMISSAKANTHGQRLRHEIVNNFSDVIDVYGKINNKPIMHKLQGLKHYRYSIVTENCDNDTYFTEKLIDCFLTGTIPIYYGTKKVDDYFMGILSFDTIEELGGILDLVHDIAIIPAIKHNFNCAKQYVMPENIIGMKLKEMGLI